MPNKDLCYQTFMRSKKNEAGRAAENHAGEINEVSQQTGTRGTKQQNLKTAPATWPVCGAEIKPLLCEIQSTETCVSEKNVILPAIHSKPPVPYSQKKIISKRKAAVRCLFKG